MNDNYWITPVLLTVFVSWFVWWVIGASNGERIGRNEGIIYCMEQPEKCKIEYQYLKLMEKTK